MTNEGPEERLQQFLDEVAQAKAATGATGELAPEEARLYHIIFEALAEDPYEPIPGLLAAVEARLVAETAAGAEALRRASAAAARPALAELVAAAALAAGLVALPGFLTTLAMLADTLARNWTSANLDLVAVAATSALLLGFVDRLLWRGSSRTDPGRETR
jgi:hypothetical protein